MTTTLDHADVFVKLKIRKTDALSQLSLQQHGCSLLPSASRRKKFVFLLLVR